MNNPSDCKTVGESALYNLKMKYVWQKKGVQFDSFMKWIVLEQWVFSLEISHKSLQQTNVYLDRYTEEEDFEDTLKIALGFEKCPLGFFWWSSVIV